MSVADVGWRIRGILSGLAVLVLAVYTALNVDMMLGAGLGIGGLLLFLAIEYIDRSYSGHNGPGEAPVPPADAAVIGLLAHLLTVALFIVFRPFSGASPAYTGWQVGSSFPALAAFYTAKNAPENRSFAIKAFLLSVVIAIIPHIVITFG